jgi:uncharacterized phage protein gp47/JayE
VTDNGYKRQTYAEILLNLTEEAKRKFGEDIDISETSVIGKFLRIIAYRESKNEEEAEKLYYSAYIATASGSSLDYACSLIAVTRKEAIAARYGINVSAENDATIDYDTVFCAENDIYFHPEAVAEIAAGESKYVTVVCDEAGVIGNVGSVKYITEAGAEKIGLTITKSERITDGEDIESDTVLRNRAMTISQGRGSGTLLGIKSALLRLDCVRYVNIVENNSSEKSSDGLPPHSFVCYVAGENDDASAQRIADTIYTNKPVGVQSYGSRTTSYYDDNGNTLCTIGFTYTTAITLDFTIVIDEVTDEETTTNAITKSISEFVNEHSEIGFSYNYLYGVVYSVDGVERINSIYVDDGSGKKNINDLTALVLNAGQIVSCGEVKVSFGTVTLF